MQVDAMAAAEQGVNQVLVLAAQVWRKRPSCGAADDLSLLFVCVMAPAPAAAQGGFAGRRCICSWSWLGKLA